jgi:hypothetical protein
MYLCAFACRLHCLCVYINVCDACIFMHMYVQLHFVGGCMCECIQNYACFIYLRVWMYGSVFTVCIFKCVLAFSWQYILCNVHNYETLLLYVVEISNFYICARY